MSTLTLTVFVILLAVAMAYALRSPSMAVAIGVATYGLEQMTANLLPWFTIHQSAFNIIVALLIAVSFLLALKPGFVFFETRSGFDTILLVWAYIALFCVSGLWSPSTDMIWAWQAAPYFVVYVLMLPLLAQGPAQMLASFSRLWVLSFLGLLGTLLSPVLIYTLALNRLIIDLSDGEGEGANPLAFADAAALLALLSVMMLFRIRDNRGGMIRTMTWLSSLFGVGLGLWLAFITSRGEFIACLFSGIILVILVTQHKPSRALRHILVGATVLGGVLFLAYLQFQDAIIALSPRFASGNLLIAFAVRGDLQVACLAAGRSSVLSTLVGLGANGCQARVGLYPHNEIVQAIAETGILGVGLLSLCYFFALRFGFRTLTLAKLRASRDGILISALAISLMVYQLLVSNKRGTLTNPDTFMWIALGTMIFDRAQASLRGSEGTRDVNLSPRAAELGRSR